MRRLSNDEIQHYQEQGFVVLPRLLEEPLLSLLLDECMSAWHQEKAAFDKEATWLQNALLPNIHHRSELVRKYYFTGPLVDVAEALIGPNIKGATSQLTFKMRGNTQAFGWHQDNGYGQLDPANAISALTALDDTDERNGCLWIIPGSHQQGQIDVTDHFSAASKTAGAELNLDIPDADQAIPVPLQAGDAAIFHGHLLHRSEGNRSATRNRRILFLRYADADAVEIYNGGSPRLGPLLRGVTRFPEVASFEKELADACSR